jgi:hypothetical protein
MEVYKRLSIFVVVVVVVVLLMVVVVVVVAVSTATAATVVELQSPLCTSHGLCSRLLRIPPDYDSPVA